MSWCDESGLPTDSPYLGVVPFERRRELQKLLARQLSGMGWTVAQIGNFFNRGQTWVNSILFSKPSGKPKEPSHCLED